MTAPAPDLGFVHRFILASKPEGAPTLLLLHGTGGDEGSLLPLGHILAPGVAMLAPRGKVLENGMPRFFRRLAEGVFDLDDLRRRTHELADFVEAASGVYGFDRGKLVAVGYSNGANIAASMLLLRPGVLAAAALFRPMVLLVPETPPDLSDVSVFISAGRQDPFVPTEQTERLLGLLGRNGANVRAQWQAAGHDLRGEEIEAAREWFAGWVAERRTEG